MCWYGMKKVAVASFVWCLPNLVAGDLADEVNFFLSVGLSIWAENIMEPHGGLAVDVRMLPGIPPALTRLKL